MTDTGKDKAAAYGLGADRVTLSTALHRRRRVGNPLRPRGLELGFEVVTGDCPHHTPVRRLGPPQGWHPPSLGDSRTVLVTP